ncbi:MAG: hypothetical protein GTN76_04655 [Candidatus Aenigmarchaeota archaeon]|nr:hypothetical protein [Candidatus Aenigmarchaeota archaeon]
MILHNVRPELEAAKGIINGLILSGLLLAIPFLFLGCYLDEVRWKANYNYGEGARHQTANWNTWEVDNNSSNWNIHGGVELTFKTGTRVIPPRKTLEREAKR